MVSEKQLLIEYETILKTARSQLLERDTLETKDLSGIFLPNIPDGYNEAKNKIMIIGRETRAWQNEVKLTLNNGSYDYGALITTSTNRHKSFFKAQLAKPNGKGRAFHNFTRAVAKKSGENGLIYANLFCFSFNGKHPKNSKVFDEVKALSKKLLIEQVKLFKPEYIIFANGISSAKYRREFFPADINASDNVCTNWQNYTDLDIPKPNLEKFMLYNKIQCFRINHPSSQSVKSKEAEKLLIETLLPSK